MHQTERQITKSNPFTTGLVTGLGWGLAVGLLDGLPVLFELPITSYLRVRLQALLYIMVWYGLVGMLTFGLLGLLTFGLLRLLRRGSSRAKPRGSGQVLRREIGRRGLVASYSGIAAGLTVLLTGMYKLNISLKQLTDSGYAIITLLLIILGSAMGLVAGWGVYGSASWWQRGQGLLRPLRWKAVRAVVLAVFLASLVSLSTVAVYRGFLRDLPIFQPKPSGQAATPDQPNILLITIDALRADHLGAYGYDPEISPHIDGLAKRGIVFDQAIAQSSWTAPSVASFVTSLYPTELGIYFQRTLAADLYVDRARTTLAEALRNAGYRTQGYTTNVHVSTKNGHAQGFDSFVDLRYQLSFDIWSLHQRALYWLLGRDPTGTGCKLFDLGYDQLFDPPLVRRRRSGPTVTYYGKRFLQLHRDERFFLWLYYMEPHTVYNPSKPFRPMPDEVSPARQRFLRTLDLPTLSGEEVIRPADLQALVSLYDGEIVDVDAMVGEVLDELERQGLAGRTVVIVNSDHGEEFQDHGDFTHGHTLYDELLRVPFIISGPTVEVPGRRVETQVSLLDLVPTVCEIAGAPIPEEAEGRSLVPLLRGEEMEELPVFSEVLHTTIFQRKSVRHDGYKLIYDIERETAELYDVRADPREQVDLAEEKLEVVGEMLAELEAWIVYNARVATELPRQRAMSQTMDDETRQQLRDAGY
jgi:arylsulfatase A-like enzyme